jgi:4-diphosphocytidyl-2-C-methyl-D-erythritol kinase
VSPSVAAGAESRWPAPAKLNLFLHVTARRADGYHELQTLFQLIDLADTIAIRVREDGAIERPEGPRGVAPEADLAVRAAHALKTATGVALGADLKVHKRIPLGGGLGGGSSDAATTRVPLGRMYLFLLKVFRPGGRGSASVSLRSSSPSGGTW